MASVPLVTAPCVLTATRGTKLDPAWLDFLKPCTQVQGWVTLAIRSGSAGADAPESDSRGVWHRELAACGACLDRRARAVNCQNHNHHNHHRRLCTRVTFFLRFAFCIPNPSGRPMADRGTGSAWRRRQRRLRHERQTVALELVAALHHSRDVGPEQYDVLRGQKTTNSGTRPASLAEPQGTQVVLERHVADQVLCAPVAQIFDALVPQEVDGLMFIEKSLPIVAEQVVEVPKIFLQDRIPQRPALRGPQLAEQLVEVNSFVVLLSRTLTFQSRVVEAGTLQGLVPGQGSTVLRRADFAVSPQGSTALGGRWFVGQVFFAPDAVGPDGFIESLTAQAELDSGGDFSPQVMSCGSPLGSCPLAGGKLLTWRSCEE